LVAGARIAAVTPPVGYESAGGAAGIDWIRFGQLLRHELGWDETYPAYPLTD